jgi:hypothetical protein
MTINTFSLINQVGRDQLRDLIGLKLESLSGETLPDFLMAPSVTVKAGDQIVTIFGKTDDSEIPDFEGYASTLCVARGSLADLTLHRQAGNIYKQYSGSEITGIGIVREDLESVESGKANWQHSADIAIVLELQSGFLVISKMGQHDEVLRVQFLKSFDIDGIPKLDSYFEEDILTTIRSSRNYESLLVV